MKLSYLPLFISMVCVCSSIACAEKLPANPWLSDTVKSSVNNNTNALQKVQKTTATAAGAVLDSAPANPWSDKSGSSGASLQKVHDQLVDTFETSAQNVRDLAKRAQDIKQSADTINQLQNAAESDGKMPSGEQLSALMNNVKKIVADGNNNEDDSSANSASWLQNLKSNPEQPQNSSMTAISKAVNEYRKTTDNYKRQINNKYNATRRKIQSYTNTARKAVEYIEKNSGIDTKEIQKMMK
ncbi:MAG: hypothetical protein J6N49_05565 [Alphaproteobacteria bacterium]|nr:hypothetical protein [Alphaproteobacteria bacterium]